MATTRGKKPSIPSSQRAKIEDFDELVEDGKSKNGSSENDENVEYNPFHLLYILTN